LTARFNGQERLTSLSAESASFISTSSQITYSWDEETESTWGDLSQVARTLAERIEADRETGREACTLEMLHMKTGRAYDRRFIHHSGTGELNDLRVC
jgi:hypothetical protein